MPELPEVYTTLRGIRPYAHKQRIMSIIVRQSSLRWPVPEEIHRLEGQTIEHLSRRAKYLLMHSASGGAAIVHLGMSGSLRICVHDAAVEKHDHVDFVLSSGKTIRLRDPRRFGAVLWSSDPLQHPLLKSLGPEPLSDDFDARRLFELSRGKRCNVKSFIMDSKVVVGVGNIYANESLFMAGINPKTQAGRISLGRYGKLVATIKQVLASAIEQGGTTLRDFVSAEGQSGYFQLALQVYGRAGQACSQCGQEVRHIVQNQRSTFYCPRCQK